MFYFFPGIWCKSKIGAAIHGNLESSKTSPWQTQQTLIYHFLRGGASQHKRSWWILHCQWLAKAKYWDDFKWRSKKSTPIWTSTVDVIFESTYLLKAQLSWYLCWISGVYITFCRPKQVFGKPPFYPNNPFLWVDLQDFFQGRPSTTCLTCGPKIPKKKQIHSERIPFIWKPWWNK